MLGTYDYPRSHRLFEIFSITVFGAFASVLAWRTLDGIATRTTWSSYPLHIMALLAGYAAADLASGIVHYLLDNFGSPNTPIIGQKFVKPFRDHHVDPMEMVELSLDDGDYQAGSGPGRWELRDSETRRVELPDGPGTR